MCAHPAIGDRGEHPAGQQRRARGEYGEAARQYQRALDMADSYRQLGVLKYDRGGPVTSANLTDGLQIYLD